MSIERTAFQEARTSRLAAQDILAGFRSIRISLHFAWGDVKARYKRSLLGPLWQSLGTLIGIVGLGVVWSQLLKMDMHKFVPTMAIGLVVWQMIAGILAEGCGLFIRQAPIIRNLVQPYSTHAINLVIRHLVNFAHSFAVLVVVAWAFGSRIGPQFLLVVPGLLLLIVNLLWISLALGILGARFRDLEYGVTSLLPVLFLITPVMYTLDYLPFPPTLLLANPFTYFVEVVRQPMLGNAPPSIYYPIMASFAFLGWCITFFLMRRAKARLPFWI